MRPRSHSSSPIRRFNPILIDSHRSTSGSAASSGSTVAKNFDVCTALPAATASQITGTTFNKTTVSDVEGVVFGCDYDGPNSALLQVSVDTEGATYVFQGDISAMKSVGHGPTMVSGVGDEAFSTPDPAGNIGASLESLQKTVFPFASRHRLAISIRHIASPKSLVVL